MKIKKSELRLLLGDLKKILSCCCERSSLWAEGFQIGNTVAVNKEIKKYS